MPGGYICGYPVAIGSSEHWGFVAGQGGFGGLQGAAVAAAAAIWGEPGSSELSFGVCKSGFRPFDASGQRLFGCARHSPLRAAKIERGGLRPGWASFEHPDWQYKPPPPSPAAAAGARPTGAPGGPLPAPPSPSENVCVA